MDIKLYQSKLFDIFIVLIDIFLVVISSKISKMLLTLLLNESAVDSTNISLITALLFYVISIIFMLYIYDFYTKTIRSKFENLLSIGITIFISTLLNIIIQFACVDLFKTVSFFYFLFMSVILFFLISSWKMILLYVVKKLENASKLLVVASKDVELTLAKKIKYSYSVVYDSWYVLIDVNNQDEIDKLINVTFDKYDGIFISPNIPTNLRDLLVSKSTEQNKMVYMLPDYCNISFMNNEIVQFDDTPALRIRPYGLTKGQRVIKRIIDITISILGILLALPIFIITPIAIRIDSRGPAIYKQLRVTRYQKKFNIYKFRTMFEDAESQTGAILSTENDPRITRVGKFLRLTRIDELPQLFNVLFNDMSIVGPRPERPFFVEQYLNEVENYDKRFYVKAGITGLAQVYARYDTNTKDKILYDLLYIKGYTLFTDIKLILLTIKTIFIKKSAEGVKEDKFNHANGIGING